MAVEDDAGADVDALAALSVLEVCHQVESVAEQAAVEGGGEAVGISLAAVLLDLAPIFVMILSAFIFKESTTARHSHCRFCTYDFTESIILG